MGTCWNDACNRLVGHLAGLYPDRDKARLVVRQAGLDPDDIDFSGVPKVFWTRVVEEANRRGKVQALIDGAKHDFPNADADFASLEQQLRVFALGGPEQIAPVVKGSPLIVFKGLRAFDEHDAGFFLELLPGPRDEAGLPESVRFWKARVEERDPDKTFRVGVLYGPSGCGKSSLLKAGILPHLADSVTHVYVEAGADTERRLLHGLQRYCPTLPQKPNLALTLAGKAGMPPGRKVLLVIDQFEQWLHARRDYEGEELVEGLRECDGEKVQCLLLVRADYWMPLSRFLKVLGVRQQEGVNMALVDLFDQRHARKVLAAFGSAFEAFDADASSREQEAFLEAAVKGLEQGGRVVSVRLVLFAQMMKGMPWTLANLKDVGGVEGIGVAFLEETFSAKTAPIRHQLQQPAVRAVLNRLLPEPGSDIRGAMRAEKDLLEASGCASRPTDFEEVLQILDAEVRLITPTAPAEVRAEGNKPPAPRPPARYYQLTHDYLVPMVRDWLNRKRKETFRGRAQLRLEERWSEWRVKRDPRYLPTIWEWLRIRLLVRTKDMTESQRAMLDMAESRHMGRTLLTVGVVSLMIGAVIGLGAYRLMHAQRRMDELVGRLVRADINGVPGVVDEIGEFEPVVAEKLRREYTQAGSDANRRVRASLALLPVDESQVDFLREQLLESGPEQARVIHSEIRRHKGQGVADEQVERLWGVLEDAKRNPHHRFRAACALAAIHPPRPEENAGRWRTQTAFLADYLVASLNRDAGQYDLLATTFDPLKSELLPRLSVLQADGKRDERERAMAKRLLTTFTPK
jgi:hypothetical protein